MYKCKISIIVPVYNAENRLSLCIESIINQTIKDIEVILINDGSTDKSPEICDDYSKKDSRIKVIHQENGGPSKARNVGIEKANGEYLGFVDSDDTIESCMFEKLYKKAKENNSDISLCSYDIVTVTATSNVKVNFKENYNSNEEIKSDLLFRYYSNKNKNGLFSLWNKIIKKNLVVSNHIKFKEKLVRAEDSWFIFDCLNVSNRIYFLNESLYHYFQNENSIMHTVRLDQYEKWVYTRKKLLKENENLKFEINEKDFYFEFLYNTVIFCRSLVKTGKIEEVEKIIKDDFYQNSLKYISNQPYHIKFLLNSTKNKKHKFSIFLYKIWSLINLKD